MPKLEFEFRDLLCDSALNDQHGEILKNVFIKMSHGYVMQYYTMLGTVLPSEEDSASDSDS